MPPGKVKLTDAEIDHLWAWINKGVAPQVAQVVNEYEVRAIFQARCGIGRGGLKHNIRAPNTSLQVDGGRADHRSPDLRSH
jgi:hypothetical protein